MTKGLSPIICRPHAFCSADRHPYSMRLRGIVYCILLASLWTATASAQGLVLDEIVAVVADKIILRSDVDALAYSVVQQQEGLEYTDDVWAQSLNQLIDQRVLAEHARRDTNIAVTDDQVNQSIDQRIDMLTRQVGTVTRLEEIYGQSVAEIREDLREVFRENLMAEQFQNTKLRTITVTPSEIREWFAQFPTDSLPTLPTMIRASHIVRYAEVSEEAEQEALEIVTAIRDSILAENSTLEEMALRFSEDIGSANNGGRYENMVLSDLVPEFAAVASRATPGELSAPFKSPFGYHILRVNSRIGESLDFSHVLINIDKSKADPTDAIAMLSLLRDSLETTPVPFELLARRHSEEPNSAEIGGRVTDPQTGERDLFLEALGPEWQALADTLEVGAISQPGPLTLQDGTIAYHIVRIQRLVPEHRVDIETDYARIEALALNDKRTRLMRAWLDSLRDEVYIETRGKGQELLNVAQHTSSY